MLKSLMWAARMGATKSGTAWRGSPTDKISGGSPGGVVPRRSVSLAKGERMGERVGAVMALVSVNGIGL